jgi:hypothetical protein
LQPFPHESIMTTLAELSIAVVGFSMLASVFRGANNRHRLIGFRNVAEIGLISAFGSLAPLLLHTFGFPEGTSWRLGTGLFGLLLLIGFITSMRRGRVGSRPKRTALVNVALICVPVLFGLACANAFFPSTISGGRHVLAVTLSLTVASLLFLQVAFDMDLKPPSGEGDDEASPGAPATGVDPRL